jgi:hypothetical protein
MTSCPARTRLACNRCVTPHTHVPIGPHPVEPYAAGWFSLDVDPRSKRTPHGELHGPAGHAVAVNSYLSSEDGFWGWMLEV